MSNTNAAAAPLASVGKIGLHQAAGVIAKLQFVYLDGATWHHLDGTDQITVGSTVTVDPGAYGVPEGALFSPYAFVVWGMDHQSQETFTYQHSNPLTATFTLSGTTLANSLVLDGIA